MANCRDIDDVRIPRMHGDAADLARIVEPEVSPRAARIG